MCYEKISWLGLIRIPCLARIEPVIMHNSPHHYNQQLIKIVSAEHGFAVSGLVICRELVRSGGSDEKL